VGVRPETWNQKAENRNYNSTLKGTQKQEEANGVVWFLVCSRGTPSAVSVAGQRVAANSAAGVPPPLDVEVVRSLYSV
jgi:hypothetical protein